MRTSGNPWAVVGLLSGLMLVAASGEVQVGAASDRVVGPIGEKVDTYLSRLVPFGFWGAALIAIDGEVVLQRGYGWADQENRSPNNGEVVFGIQSISKQFTAAAIMTLVQKEMLSTDDTITEFIDGVPEDKTEITVHQLLTHTSGLLAGTEAYLGDGTRAGVLSAILEAPLQHAPGESFSYSNMGYVLLAMIIENRTGRDFESYLRDEVLKPVGLEFTGYRIPDWTRRTIAHSYADGRDNGTPLDRHYPDWNYIGCGGLLSTAGDLFRWDLALAGERILGREAKKQMYTPDQNGYAYGWKIEESERGRVIRHNGGESDGRASTFRRYLDAGITLIIFSNRDGEEMLFGNGIVGHIEALVFGDEFPMPPHAQTSIAIDLEQHAGTYQGAAGSLQVDVQGGMLMVRASGQQLIEATLGLDGTGSYSEANSRAEKALNALAEGDTSSFASLLADPPKNRVPTWIRQRVEGGEARLGRFQKFTVLGTTPDWVSGFGTMMTFAQAEFENGAILFRLHWGEKGVMALGGSGIPVPVRMAFLPTGDMSFAGYHLATGHSSRLRFDGASQLILGEGNGALTLVR